MRRGGVRAGVEVSIKAAFMVRHVADPPAPSPQAVRKGTTVARGRPRHVGVVSGGGREAMWELGMAHLHEPMKVCNSDRAGSRVAADFVSAMSRWYR